MRTWTDFSYILFFSWKWNNY